MFRIAFLAVTASALMTSTASAQSPGKPGKVQLGVGFSQSQWKPSPFGGVQNSSGFLNLGVNKPNGTVNLGIGGSTTQWQPNPFGGPVVGQSNFHFNLGIKKKP